VSGNRESEEVVIAIEIRHLRYFVAVAGKLHFTRAAEELHVAQPALSHQIQRLEASLQVRLLERSTRAVTLTEAGTDFLVWARAAVAAYDAALDAAARLRSGEAGRLTLGANPRTHHDLISSVTAALNEACPDIVIDIVTKATSMLVDDVRDGRLDVALCLCPVTTPGLNIEVAIHEPLFVAMREDHRLASCDELTLLDLRDEIWLLPSDRKAIGYNTLIRQRCLELGFEILKAPVHPDYDNEFSLVAAGTGIELAPEAFIGKRSIPGVRFVPMSASHSLPMALVWRQEGADPALGRLLDVVRELRDQLGWRQDSSRAANKATAAV
jgi:DNA-binding transcriptional LysR family regulator